MTPQTILVTGSAGFIGFSVSRALLEQGHTVIGVDCLNDYYAVELKRARHDILSREERFTACEIDLCDYAAAESVFREHRPERVCHLAAQAGVRYSLTHPFAYQKSNLEAVLNILELCRHAEVERLVYASSSSVYGGNEEQPFSETQRVDTPISLYAATKRANELMAHSYTHLFGLQTIGLRFFTVYGPWGRPDMAMWLFTESIHRGKPIKVFNHGDMKRDFTYIDDIVAGVVASLFTDGLDPYEVMNLGNHRSEPLLKVIGLIEKELDIEAEKVMLPMQPGDIKESFADVERARAKLGYEPTTPVEDGIRAFVRWYLENPELAQAVRTFRERDA